MTENNTLKQRISKVVRVSLKYSLNQLTRRLARSGIGPFALVLHKGRRSGKPYETPILLGRIGTDLMVELTYGPNVDWYKNVQAAGGCSVLWRKKAYEIDRIDEVEASTGRNAFPQPARQLIRLFGMKHFVKLHVRV